MQRIGWTSALVWLVAAAQIGAAGPTTAQALRLAVVNGAGSESLRNLVDLVAVNLNADHSLQLLERQDVQSVLSEQEVGRGSLSDPARAVAVGRLLSVDIFAVLTAQPAGTGLIVYDGRSGARLVDQILDGKSAESEAGSAAAIIQSAIVKQSAPTHPVCLLTVRNADLGSSMDCFCDGIGQILQRRLLTSKDVTVLERQYLDQVNQERALPTSKPSALLTPSMQFLELEISRGSAAGSYIAAVFLSDSNGRRLGTVNATAGDPGTLVDQLLSRLVEKLGATSPRSPDLVLESMRFGSESDFFRSHAQPASALAASEAAYALNPGDGTNQQRLAKDLAGDAMGNPIDVAARQLERALDLCNGYERRSRGAAGLNDGSYFDVERQIETFSGEHCLSGNQSALNAELESLRSHYRDYQIRRVQKWAAGPGAVRHNAAWADSAESSAAGLWGRVIPHLNATALTRVEFAADLDEVVGNQWLAVYEKRIAHDWNEYPNYANLSSLIKCIFGGFERWRPYGYFNRDEPGGLSPPEQDLREYARAIPPLYQKFAASHDPVLQFCGTAGKAWCDALTSGCSLTDLETPFQPVAALAKQIIEGSSDAGQRDQMYVVWELAIDLFFRPTDHVIDDNSTPSRQRLKELYIMWDFRKARHEFPLVTKNTQLDTAPWSHAERVCEVHKTPGLQGIDAIIRPLVRDGSVWAIGLGRDSGRQFMQLLRLPLIEGTAQRLARLDADWHDDRWSPPGVSSYSGAVLAADCYYLGSRDKGILAFPLDGRKGFSIAGKDDLPSDHVDSITYLAPYLYAGLGDGGYVIRLNPKTSRCEVLASSRRKEKRSPLDDDVSWTAPCMVADPPRGRVIVLAGRNDRGGIWQIDNNGALSQMDRTGDADFGNWFSEVDDDHLIISSNAWILDLNLRNDRAEFLHKNQYWVIRSNLVLPQASVTPNVTPWAPYMHVAGWLWAGHDFTRTNITTGQIEDLPELSSRGGHERVVPIHVLQPFDDGRHVLMGDQSKLWMLTFDAGYDCTTRP